MSNHQEIAVNLTGYIPENELSIFLNDIDLVVLPYHTCTGTSGVVHLAISYGIPIVSTDLPEFRELIEEGCMILLSKHDPQFLAEKIEFVLKNPNIMMDLRKKNLVFAEKRTWDKIAKAYLKIYMKLLRS